MGFRSNWRIPVRSKTIPWRLNTFPVGKAIVISWPKSATGLSLEAKDNLTTLEWTAVGGWRVITAAKQTVTLTAYWIAKFY